MRRFFTLILALFFTLTNTSVNAAQYLEKEIKAVALNSGNVGFHVVPINYYFCQYALLSGFWSQ